MPATVALLASEISDAEDEEGSPAHGDDSSVEYAVDLNESPDDDDEATLEEEEVCRPYLGIECLCLTSQSTGQMVNLGPNDLENPRKL